MSNLLGEVYEPVRASSLISGSELIEREGVDLQKGMNFRDGGDLISVFLVLQHDGVFKDAWDERMSFYSFRGHDSTTGAGREHDQIAMYESGRLSDNGKFLKAARAFSEGARTMPLQVQVYEKVSAGVWFDKGIFNLVDARQEKEDSRNVFTFLLRPANLARVEGNARHAERMMSATEKAEIWERAHGRCEGCGTQTGLRFVPRESVLKCPDCRGEHVGLLG